MNDPIIIGLVVGGGVALITGYISHWFRLSEMKIQSAKERERLEALWAKEERRRKSDRRREIYERELRPVGDAMHVLMEAIGKVRWSEWVTEDPKMRLAWIREAWVMMWKASVVGISPMDQELADRFDELVDIVERWHKTLDLNTGGRRAGVKEEQYEELLTQMRLAIWKVRGRMSRLLEGV